VPYYQCRSCGLRSYSAAGYSTATVCPECDAPLTAGSNGFRPTQQGLRRNLPARPGSAAEARRAVRALPLSEADCETIVLLVSELVTNAIRHAGSSAHDPSAFDQSIDLHVSHRDGHVRIAVRDNGPGFSDRDLGAPREHGGLGLMVVEALAKRWGVDREPDGCTVWCTVEAAATA
jgi:anti-sigma regulatory factor (Ser/Thr protein kinase)